MTDPNPMLQEMIRVNNNLSITAVRTKGKIDAKMRVTIKDLLGYRYDLKTKPIEVTGKSKDLIWHIENADKLSDALFGVSSGRRQFVQNAVEWNRTRPLRIYNYVQKLADIFPSEHLTSLLRTSLNHTPVEIISIYETNKGEARQSDYCGEPTGVDPTQFKSI